MRKKYPLSCISFVACFAVVTAGCGSGGGRSAPPPPPSQAVVITGDPASQTIPIGRTATFTVSATGTPPLAYQWSKGSTPIVGATSASYTTPAVALADSGSTYQVTVSNSVNSKTSAAATLTAGPRAPAIGDLRYLLFQQISTPNFFSDPGEHTNILPSTTATAPNSLGTPMSIGSSWACYPGVAYDCAWTFDIINLPAGQTGYSMTYTGGTDGAPAANLHSVFAPNTVITGLDLEPAESSYAFSYVTTTQPGGFDSDLEVVPLSGLQAATDADGAASRIVTAISIDAVGNANFVSTGWQGDPTTIYETQALVADANPTAIAAAANSLAASGYIITAFGGNDSQGYILIGTRAAGETLPRPIEIFVSTAATNPSADLTLPYYTIVLNVGFDGAGQIIVNER